MTSKQVKLRSPLSKDDVLSLSAGDTVYISGPAYEIKAVPQYMKILEAKKRGKKLPFDPTHATVYHTFSSVQKVREKWKVNYLGFFSSFVLNNQMPDFIRTFEIRAIIGKGGMSNKVLEVMKEYGCVYLAGVSGCAAYYTQGVKKVMAVYFEEWGPQRVVAYELTKLGPLLVTMDAHGDTLYKEIEKQKQTAMKDILEALRG